MGCGRTGRQLTGDRSAIAARPMAGKRPGFRFG